MNKFFNATFVFLLISYPFINMLPIGVDIFGKIWAGVGTIFVFSFILLKLNYINRYMISTFVLFIFIFISIFLSNEVNFIKILSGYKYMLPLLISSYIYFYPIDGKFLNQFYRITFIFIVLMLILFLYRLSYIDYNILQVTAFKDYMWYDKAHNFAQMYILLCVTFLYLSYLLKKNIYLAYFFFIPLFFTGVRSVLVGTIIFLIIIMIPIIKKNFAKSLITIFFIISTLFIINPNIDKLIPLFLSAQDAERGADKATFTSMSSGRDIILNYYIDNIDSERIFIGSGLQYLEKDASFTFGLHNDTLEFFFSFGIFGFSAFIFAIYYNIFYDAYRNTVGLNKYFIVSLTLLFLSVSSFAFFFYNQLMIYLFVLIYLIKNYEIPKRGV